MRGKNEYLLNGNYLPRKFKRKQWLGITTYVLSHRRHKNRPTEESRVKENKGRQLCYRSKVSWKYEQLREMETLSGERILRKNWTMQNSFLDAREKEESRSLNTPWQASPTPVLFIVPVLLSYSRPFFPPSSLQTFCNRLFDSALSASFLLSRLLFSTVFLFFKPLSKLLFPLTTSYTSFRLFLFYFRSPLL